MRYPKTTLLAAASGLALLASLALPANATPSLAPSSTSSGDLILVKGGGGGGGGGGGHMGGGGGGGGAHFGAIGGGGGMGGGRVGGGGGGMAMHGVPHGGNSFAHMGGGNNAHIARGNNFNGNVGRQERFANNWNGNRHDHDRHGHFNRFYAYPFFYGDYYAYNNDGYGSCNWFYRRAVTSNSPYWWNRYYACAG